MAAYLAKGYAQHIRSRYDGTCPCTLVWQQEPLCVAMLVCVCCAMRVLCCGWCLYVRPAAARLPLCCRPHRHWDLYHRYTCEGSGGSSVSGENFLFKRAAGDEILASEPSFHQKQPICACIMRASAVARRVAAAYGDANVLPKKA